MGEQGLSSLCSVKLKGCQLAWQDTVSNPNLVPLPEKAMVNIPKFISPVTAA